MLDLHFVFDFSGRSDEFAFGPVHDDGPRHKEVSADRVNQQKNGEAGSQHEPKRDPALVGSAVQSGVCTAGGGDTQMDESSVNPSLPESPWETATASSSIIQARDESRV
jgi:hypothetical protein